jgi:hypothetical protein
MNRQTATIFVASACAAFRLLGSTDYIESFENSKWRLGTSENWFFPLPLDSLLDLRLYVLGTRRAWERGGRLRTSVRNGCLISRMALATVFCFQRYTASIALIVQE